jgi:hypothetical protein
MIFIIEFADGSTVQINSGSAENARRVAQTTFAIG